MPGTFNPTNPVAVGLSTKADHFHRAFNNGLATYYGETGIVGAAAGDDPYFSTANQLSPGARQLRQTFRGLTLRTHPDADMAASKVYLDHADEIVMHDGTRVADWDDLAADITVSGANGLDTGAEGASRWYEIHAIRQSSGGTKGLLLHRAKNYFLDESQNTIDSYLSVRASAAQAACAQTFDVDVTGPCPFVGLTIKKSAAPTGQIWCELLATSAGVPTGSPLATSDKLDVANISTSDQAAWFVFRSPPTLTAGVTYAIVLTGNYSYSVTDRILIAKNSAGGYAAGALYYDLSGAWSTSGVVGHDAWFQLYVTENDAPVTMPSGYDQRCLIGWVYNNSSSNFWKFAAIDRECHYPHFDLLAVNASAVTVPTLTNLAVFVPPVPALITKVFCQASAAATAVLLSTTPGGDASLSWASAGNTSYGQDVVANVPVEFQHCYYAATGGGSGYVYIRGFKW
jgi:hypothetical protein